MKPGAPGMLPFYRKTIIDYCTETDETEKKAIRKRLQDMEAEIGLTPEEVKEERKKFEKFF